MLWRDAYRTKWAKDIRSLPLLGIRLDGAAINAAETRIIAAGFDLAAFGEIRLWKNLIQTLSLPSELLSFGIFSDTEDDRTELFDAVPDSEHGIWALLRNRREWLMLVEPDSPSRAFAAILAGENIPLIMSGPPTEDAWEIFESEALSLKARLSDL